MTVMTNPLVSFMFSQGSYCHACMLTPKIALTKNLGYNRITFLEIVIWWLRPRRWTCCGTVSVQLFHSI